MAFSKTLLTELATLLKLKSEDVIAAHDAADEQDIEIPKDLTVFTKPELTTRDNNLKKVEFAKGGTAAVEKLVKEQKETLGLDFEGKDPADLITAVQEKTLAEAKITPDAKVIEKDKAIATLKATVQKLETEKAEVLGTVGKVKIQSEILKAVPTNLIAGLDSDDVMNSLEKKGYTFEEKDGVIIAKKGGELVADTQMNALPIKDVIAAHVTERNWLDTEAGTVEKDGRGGNSTVKKPTGAKPAKLSDAEKQWTADGKKTGTADYQRYLDGLSSANKEFDFEN